MKRWAADWEKTFVYHIVDKGFISKIIKNLQNNNKKINDLIKIGWMIWMHTSPKKMANRHMKICLSSLGIWEMQIKTK